MKRLRSPRVWIVLLLIVAAPPLLWFGWKDSSGGSPAGPASPADGSDSAARYSRFEAGQRQIDERVWSRELLAEDCGRTVESLWDALNASPQRWTIVQAWAPGSIGLGIWTPPISHPHGLSVQTSHPGGTTLAANAWRSQLREWELDGWKIGDLEFRHRAFDVNSRGLPDHSTFGFRADLLHPGRNERLTITGDLGLDWGGRDPATGLWQVRHVDASRLAVAGRRGPPPFERILSERIEPSKRSGSIDPILVQDLDGDGIPEILLPAVNRVYRRTGPDRYTSEPLFNAAHPEILAAAITDFDGDGLADLLGAGQAGLFFWHGTATGRFEGAPQIVWKPVIPLVNPVVLACADVNQDGRVDVFLGQYRVPTIGQILRPGFHDANDGHPSYLLLNDGHGGVTDATDAAGLSPKRFRRVYSAVFGDFGGNGHSDLAVVSDFSGLDLYQNDGHGRFTDTTTRWVPESHAFGMGTAVTDFNADGRLDLLMIGMTSATVERLDHLGLRRPEVGEDPSLRSRMTAGNRLYLGRAGGGFDAAPGGPTLARSGWSWGCTAPDFDNDGFPDLYVANGHETGRTVRDYESEFWIHDLYIDRSVDDRTATTYFLKKFAATRGDGWSYGGHENNRLYLNRGEEGFLEAGYLMGVGLPQDSRNVVSADLDGDGRMDLIVTTFEAWPDARQTLQVFRNTLPDAGNWIGFRLPWTAGGSGGEGVRIRLTAAGRTHIRQWVNGDSFRSQHPNALHFGLGAALEVDSVQILWPGGQTEMRLRPAPNTWHALHPPARRPPSESALPRSPETRFPGP